MNMRFLSQLKNSMPINEFTDRAKAYGFEGVTVDGSDFTEVYLAFKEAVKAARGKKDQN